MMDLKISSDLKERFTGLEALITIIENVSVIKEKPDLEDFKNSIIEYVRKEFDLENLKDVPVFRAYRDFFWRAGIDPTKIRPAGEALRRRILGGKPLPKINNVVDCYNLVSIKTGIAIAAFDYDLIQGDLFMRFAKEDEKFRGIGMSEPKILKGNEIVVSDDANLVAVYPYRDADATKITDITKNMLIMICGAPNIPEALLKNTVNIAIEYLTRFCVDQ